MMRSTRLPWLAGLAVLVATFAIGTASAQAERRLALVVGNSAYANATALANPANDAADVADALRSTGFEVVLGLDLDKRAFDLKLRDFSRALATADVALVFYAGHAMQIGGVNYLIPVDAKLESERDLEFETLRLDVVLNQMELGRDARTNIVFLDACRDNPLARTISRSMGTRSGSVGRGLAQVQSGVGTFISYATQPGNVALDGQGRNSPFTTALVKQLKGDGRPLNTVMIQVRNDVIAATGGRQVPWDHSALTGEFFFKPGAAGAGSSAEVAALTQRAAVLEASLKARGDTETVARLAVLKERLRDQERTHAEARQRISDTMIKQARDTDPARRRQLQDDVFAAQRASGDARQRVSQTLEEIATLEAKIAAPPTVPTGGTQTAALTTGATSGSGAAATSGSGTVVAAASLAPSAPTLVRRFASYSPEARDGDLDLYRGARPTGTPLLPAEIASTTADAAACARICKADALCIAFGIDERAGRCEFFKSIDGLAQEAGWRAGVRSKPAP